MWWQRLYGIANLVVDLDMQKKIILSLENERLKANAAGKAAGKHGPASGSGSKAQALKLKQQAKNPVWHAFRMYSNDECRQKEWIIADACQPLADWYHKQCEVKGVAASHAWHIRECSGGFWRHIKDTLATIDCRAYYERWGVETTFGDVVQDESFIAHIEQQNFMAGCVGDMLLGIAWSRLNWGMDYLCGFPRRAALFDSDQNEAAVAELRRQWGGWLRQWQPATATCAN